MVKSLKKFNVDEPTSLERLIVPPEIVNAPVLVSATLCVVYPNVMMPPESATVDPKFIVSVPYPAFAVNSAALPLMFVAPLKDKVQDEPLLVPVKFDIPFPRNILVVLPKAMVVFPVTVNECATLEPAQE